MQAKSSPIFAFVLIALAGVSFAGLVGSFLALVAGPFPLGTALYVTYFAYAGFAVVFAHSAAFLLNSYLMEKGKTSRRKVPKILEYLYVCVLSISLAQIFFSSARLADYLLVLTGQEEQAWSNVRRLAQDHVENDCGQIRTQFFTEDYCAEMKRIAQAADVKAYVFGHVVNNGTFLSHVIRVEFLVMPGDPFETKVESPVAHAIRRLHARDVYAMVPPDNVSSNAFGWIAILLIPIGISLRLVKTSLELFGDLDKS